jgi:hypothetical protein
LATALRRIGRIKGRTIVRWAIVGALRIWVGSRGITTAEIVPSATAREKLEVFADDAEFGALLACLLIFPGVQLETAFDESGASFSEVRVSHFSLAIPESDVDESGFFLTIISFRARDVAIDGKADISHSGALGSIAHFGIGCQVAHQ